MKGPVQIVLPVYNGLTYLNEAISSVFTQTRDDWHLILVDDVSTDGSRESLKLYTDPRVEVILNSRNYGLYGSLGRVLRDLPPSWVVILMQDDRLKPNYLEEMLNLASKEPECHAFWSTEDIMDETGKLTCKGADNGRVELFFPGTEAWLQGLRRGCFWIISGSFTRSDLFRDIPFKDNYPHCGDYDWLLRVLRSAPMVYYERPLKDIRIHSRSAGAVNLVKGTDVLEGYKILRDNSFAYANQLKFVELLDICMQRGTATVRRGAGALYRGQLGAAIRLMKHACRFWTLPILFVWRGGGK